MDKHELSPIPAIAAASCSQERCNQERPISEDISNTTHPRVQMAQAGPSRRGVLGGAAALVAATTLPLAAQEAEGDFWFSYADDARRDTIVLWQKLEKSGEKANEGQKTEKAQPAQATRQRLTWQRRLFGDHASFHLASPTPPSDGNNQHGPPGTRLLIKNCSFPSPKAPKARPTFDLTLALSRDKNGAWRLSASANRLWGDSEKLEFPGIDLKCFLDGANRQIPDDARAIETGHVLFSHAIRKGRLNTNLLPALFGKRIEVEHDAKFGFDAALNWHLQARDTIEVNRLRHNAIYILDLPFAFENLVFRREFSEERDNTYTPGDAPASGKGANKARQKNFFVTESQNWHPIPTRKGKLGNRPEDESKPTGLHGTLHGLKAYGKRNADHPLANLIVGELGATASRAGLDILVRCPPESLEQMPSAGKPEAAAATAAVLRHNGDPAMTLAGLRWPPVNSGTFAEIGTLAIRSGNDTQRKSEGNIPFGSLEIIRQLAPRYTAEQSPGTEDKKVSASKAKSKNKSKAETLAGVETLFRFFPTAKEVRVTWHEAGLDVSALPPVSGMPGEPPRVPPIEILTEDIPSRPNRRMLKHFSARLALHAAHLALSEHTKRLDEKPLPAAMQITTRLEFSDAELSIWLPALGKRPEDAASASVPFGPRDIADSQDTTARFGLDRARLSVLRTADLLALKFRFSGLELKVPWRETQALPALLAPPGKTSEAGLPSPGLAAGNMPDRRPMLVVDFPPQHVLEKTYFRQLPEAVVFPVLTPARAEDGKTLDELFEKLRKPRKRRGSHKGGTSASERIGWRKEILFLAQDITTPPDFIANFEKRVASGWQGGCLPKEQRYYVGEEFLDLDAYQIAHALLSPKAEKRPFPRDVTLDNATFEKARNSYAEAREKAKREGKPIDTDPVEPSGTPRRLAEILEDHKDQIDPAYREFRAKFAAAIDGFVKNRPEAEHNAFLKQHRTYFGRDWYALKRAIWVDQGHSALADALDKLLPLEPVESLDPFEPVTEARLAGPSRIAFRINPDDFEPGRQGGAIPYSLEGLTNWASMDMVVARKADHPLMPVPSGRMPPRWARQRSKSDADYLAFHGISAADKVTRKKEIDRRETKPGPPSPDALKTHVSVEQRMGEVYREIAEKPDLFQTAIELPARLMLSPAPDANWRTPSDSIQRLLFKDRDIADSFRELWTARLAETGTDGGVRAIWSPDFRPEALLARQTGNTGTPGTPPRGSYQPWALPRDLTTRSPQNEVDAFVEGHRFRATMDANDRHQLVITTSAHGLPVLGRRLFNGDIAPGASQFDPPPGYHLRGIAPETLDGKKFDLSAIYRPPALSISELTLSALGGSLNLATDFVPPAPAQVLDDKEKSINLFEALSLERWRQRTALGRDVLVEVVTKGFMFPTGHLASLVKITERRFESVTPGAPPTAFLIQRKFLRFRKLEKEFPAIGQPDHARRWCAHRMRLIKDKTPDLVDPEESQPSLTKESCNVAPTANGRVWIPGGTGLVFWPRTKAMEGGEVWFEMLIDKESSPVKLPLLFVDASAANDPVTMAEIVDYYNKCVPRRFSSTPGLTRRLKRNRQSVVMAAEHNPGDTSYETDWWDIGAEGGQSTDGNRNYRRTSFMEGQDQPPFYPFIERARCRIGQIERFSGQGECWREVQYYPHYVSNGLKGEPNLTAGETPQGDDIYLEFLQNESDNTSQANLALDIDSVRDRSGGVATPTMTYLGISRKYGPVGGSGTSAAKGLNEVRRAMTAPPVQSPVSGGVPAQKGSAIPQNGNLDTLLGDGKLLGIVKLSEVLSLLTSALDSYPQLKEVVDYGAANLAEGAHSFRETVAETVIRPLMTVVKRIEERWKAFARERLAQLGDDSLKRAFPQIGSDLEGLREALEAALNQDQSDAQFTAQLARIHAAGRRLIRTVDRIAHDPMSAISDDQINIFRDIRSQVERALDFEKPNFNSLKGTLETAVSACVRTFLDHASGAIRRFFIDWPIPLDLNDAEAEALINALDQAFIEAFGNLASISDPDKLADALSDYAKAEGASFANTLREAIQKKIDGASGTLKTSLETVRQRLEDRTAALIFSEQANEFARRLGKTTPLDVAAVFLHLYRELKARVEARDLPGVLKLVSEIAPAPLKALGVLARHQNLQAAAEALGADLCEKLRVAVVQILDAAMPAAKSLIEIGQCMDISAGSVCSPPHDVGGAFSAGATALIKALQEASKQLAALNTEKAIALAEGINDAQNEFTKGASLVVTTLRGLGQDILSVESEVTSGLKSAACPVNLATQNLEALTRPLASRLANARSGLLALSENLSKIGAALAETRSLDGNLPVPPNVVTAIREAGGALAAFGSGMLKSTIVMAGPRMKETADGTALPADLFNGLEALAKALQDKIPSVATELRTLRENVKNGLNDAISKQLKTLTDAAKELAGIVKDLGNPSIPLSTIVDKIGSAQKVLKAFDQSQREAILREITVLQGSALTQVAGLRRALMKDIAEKAFLPDALATDAGDRVRTLAAALHKGFEAANTAILGIQTRLDEIGKKSLIAQQLLDGLNKSLNTKQLLIIDVTESDQPGGLLGRETASLAKANAANNLRDVLDALNETLHPGSGSIAMLQLVQRLAKIDESVLRFVVIEALDLRQLRDEIEQLIRELIPSRVRLSYDLDMPMRPVPFGSYDLIVPQQNAHLSLAMRSDVDLLTGDAHYRVNGNVGPFKLHLFGSFEAVILNFDGINFQAGSKTGSDFNVLFKRVEIGKNAEFLKQLEEYVSPKGGGVYTRQLDNRPGIEAGYSINLGSFGCGYLSFSNVTLNAGAELPFSKGSAIFKVSIGRPDAPFLISSTIFGGGGYLALLADAKGYVGLEGSFDFGGVFAFGYGPLQGSGQITVGVTFSARRGENAQLGGVYIVRGQASIACFSIAASLVVRLNYANNRMEGEATFSFSFSLGLGDIEYHVSVKNNQGSALGTGEAPGKSKTASSNLLGGPRQFAHSGHTMSDLSLFEANTREPKISACVYSKANHWKQYRETYFDHSPVVRD